ncbi:hypothetical protein DFP77_107162 [Marinomonas foliarum]|uniref:Uncharacterized protein n=1 Tax=Marinomonas foliarum TaxID=491950 RepID=A0A369ACH7_9GAMM|nr:hypothetical protein DFP77_107162 [Marinomonas foliarum]
MNLREWLTDVYRKAKTEFILLYFFYLEVTYNPKTIQRVKVLREIMRLTRIILNLPSNGGDNG